jgi:hypothetical protein
MEPQGPTVLLVELGLAAGPVAEVLDGAEGKGGGQDHIEGDGDGTVHQDAQVPFGDCQGAAEFGFGHGSEDHGDQDRCQREEAARQAAISRQFPDLMRLEALLQRDRQLQDPDDHTRINTNLEFHAAIWNYAHNAVLRDLLDRLSTHHIHAPRSTLSTGNRWTESLDEHEALIHAIEQQDSEAAGKIARQHMETARTLRLQLLRETALQHPLTNQHSQR